jgi:DNA-binding winged helix-turn-helix (wHTH) protein
LLCCAARSSQNARALLKAGWETAGERLEFERMRISFGQHVLDTDRRQLERGRDVVRLSPKALALLEVLIGERPRSIPKHVLLDRVWPDVVVEEQNVKNTIVEIRAALRDDANHIRTVQRFGYAFSGKAKEERADQAERARYWLYSAKRRMPVEDSEIEVGRDPSCGLCLDYPGVSRRHARLALSNDTATIEDLGSKNGTWVQDQRITGPTELRDGDRIRIGSAELIFRISPGTVSTMTER